MRFQILSFPPKLGVKTSDITKLCDYGYISRSTCFESLGSCTVFKVWKKLVHIITLHCSHIRRFFMLFMRSHPWSWQAGSLQFLWFFCGKWQRRLSRKYFYAPVCRLSAPVVKLNFFWWYLCLVWLYLFSSLLVFFHKFHIYLGSDFCR